MVLVKESTVAVRTRPPDTTGGLQMPTYLMLGSLTQDGYDAMEEGPETVETFIERIDAMGGTFDGEDFHVLSGEYDWAAIVEMPSERAAAQIAAVYARTRRGRIQIETVVATSPDEYREYVDALAE